MGVGMRAALLVLVFVALAMAVGMASAAAPAKVSDAAVKKVSPALLSELDGRPPGEPVRVIVKYKPGHERSGPFGLLSADRKDSVKARIASGGGNTLKEFSTVSAISAVVPAGSVSGIASDSSVEMVYPVVFYEVERLQANPIMLASAAASAYGVNGTGINISVVDTGIFNHTEFQNPSRIMLQKCYCTNATGQGCCPDLLTEGSNATDDHGHGTHVAGIAAGQGSASYGYGMAANATLFAVKVCNSTGTCASDDIISGIEWSAANRANIVSISLGGSVSGDCYDDGIGDWIDNLTASGTLFVVAAGNSGSGSGTINSPGCAKSALTVGSVDKSDVIAGTSSRGPTNDNRTKPDVMAVGVSITSTYKNNGYASASGTSMATPAVSGEAALMMQRYRQLFGSMPDPALVKAIIMTAVNGTGMVSGGYTQRNNAYGPGRIDANQSLRIIGFTTNGSLTHGQLTNRSIRINNGTFIATLHWPENRTTRNNLDIIVGNSTVNFSQATDSNDTVEQVILFNASEGLWNIYINGTNVTGSQRYFLAWSESVSVPYWYDNRTLRTAVYNSSNVSYFNISWNGTNTLQSVFVEGNWSGSAANYTMTHYGSGNYSYNATLPDGTFYWRSWANDTAGFLNSTDNWTFIVLNAGPEISAASVSSSWALAGDNVTVFANASDWSLDSVWFNISNSSGFNAKTMMQNVSARFNGTYNTSQLAVGAYNLTVFANDTRANVTNLTIGLLNVTVPRNVTLGFNSYDSSSANVSVTVFYNGTGTARNYSDNITGLSSTLPEGLWDVRLSSTFNATLFGVNTSSNATGNITIDDVPNSNVSLSGFVAVQVVAVESGINFTNATIILSNSSINASLNTTVLACHSWNMSNRSCGGSWSNVTENSSISSGLVSINTPNLSAFAVARNTTCGDGLVDSGETSSTCCEDAGCASGQSCSTSTHACYTPPSSASPSSGGGGGGAVSSKKKLLAISATASVRPVKGTEAGFAISLLNNGDYGLSGIRLSHNTTCGGCSLGYFTGNISLDINHSRELSATFVSNASGRFSVDLKASASGVSNSTMLVFDVTECEPDSRSCDGDGLVACSPDGMSSSRSACENGCSAGRCMSNVTMNIANSTATGGAEIGWGYIAAAAAAVVVMIGLLLFLLAKAMRA